MRVSGQKISKTLRDKILTYLALLERQQGSPTVHSPLNRVEMADYLCVNRSAMTRELAAMKQEGLIDFNKNEFYLNGNAVSPFTQAKGPFTGVGLKSAKPGFSGRIPSITAGSS